MMARVPIDGITLIRLSDAKDFLKISHAAGTRTWKDIRFILYGTECKQFFNHNQFNVGMDLPEEGSAEITLLL